MELAPRPLRPAARGRDRQRTRRTTSEGQFRARIRASSNLAESFLSHDLSPSPSPNPPPPHISRLVIVIAVIVVVSRGGRSFSPSQTRTTMQSVRDKSYFVLRVPLPASPVIVAIHIYIYFFSLFSLSLSLPQAQTIPLLPEERAQPRKSRGALRENAFLIQLVTSSRRVVSGHLAIFSFFFFFFFLGSCDYFVSEREISRDDRTGSMASFSDTEIVPSSAD